MGDSVSWDTINDKMANNNVSKDFYSKYLIPIFFVLVAITTFLSIYDAISTMLDERIRSLSMLRTIGMTAKDVFKLMVLEIAVTIVVAVPIGFLLFTNRELYGILK
jgi:ABC-type antimicrobial peptide transport system permease subunit